MPGGHVILAPFCTCRREESPFAVFSKSCLFSTGALTITWASGAISDLFPVEHVQTHGGQTSFESWDGLKLATRPSWLDCLSAVFNICFNILIFLQTHIPGGQSCGSWLPSKRALFSVVISWWRTTFFINEAASVVFLVIMTISDRFPVEQVQTPGGQASFWTAEIWNSFDFSVRGPERAMWTWKTCKITQMAKTYIVKIRIKRLVNRLFQRLPLLCLFGCVPSEMSESLLAFQNFYWRSTAEEQQHSILVTDWVCSTFKWFRLLTLTDIENICLFFIVMMNLAQLITVSVISAKKEQQYFTIILKIVQCCAKKNVETYLKSIV